MECCIDTAGPARDGPALQREQCPGPRHGDLLRRMTVQIVQTYTECGADFSYSLEMAPRRVLTKQTKPFANDGHDNADGDYICHVGEEITGAKTYMMVESLGKGAFGQVLECSMAGGGQAAVKIIKNRPSFNRQAFEEVRILQTLNERFGQDDRNGIIRMLEHFQHKDHWCIAFELLSFNLYEVLRRNKFSGLQISRTRIVVEQLLKALLCLQEVGIIHCDLKPENIVLAKNVTVKLIDFGSSCFADSEHRNPYIQSRFYRSPEVLLGMRYTTAIDMWSLGCVCGELCRGLPIFPGHSSYDQVRRIVEAVGLPERHLLEEGTFTRKYFHRVEVGGFAGDCNSDSTAAEFSSDVPGGAPTHLSRTALQAAAKLEGGPKLEGRRQLSLSSVIDFNSDGVSDDMRIGAGFRAKGHGGGKGCAQEGEALVGGKGGKKSRSSRHRRRGTGVEIGEGEILGEASAKSKVAWQSGKGCPTEVTYRLKSRSEFETFQTAPPANRAGADLKSLAQIVEQAPVSRQDVQKERTRREHLLEFLQGVLELDPAKRWAPSQAMNHPFIQADVSGPDHRVSRRDSQCDAGSAAPQAAVEPPGN